MNGQGAIFALYDSKAEAFMPTFNAATNAVAIRVITNMVNGNQKDVVSTHPGDFSLFRLGSFDLESGEIKPEKTHLGNCLEFVQNAENMIGGKVNEVA